MKKTLLSSIFLVACFNPAGAQNKAVGRVVECSGAQLRTGLHTPKTLTARTKLAQGASLSLPAAGHALLLFYRDGHREDVTGPCLVRLNQDGCQVIHGGSKCLARVAVNGLHLVLPQGGNMQSVGGSIAGISDPSQVEGSIVLRSRDTEPRPRDSDVISFAYSQNQGKPSLTLASGDLSLSTLSLKEDGHKPLALTEVNKVIGLPDLKLGRSYKIVVLSNRDQISQVVPFRILPPGEEKELQSLLADQKKEDQVLIIDRLDELGLPSLAAERASALLAELEYKDAGLLNYLYHLYSGVLSDPDSANFIKLKAKELKYPLKS